MGDDESDEWRFSVDEVGPDDESGDEASDADRDAAGESDAWGVTIGEDDDGPTVRVGDGAGTERLGEDGGNVAGTLAPETPVEPGRPELENAAFATAGAIFTALVLAAVVVPLDLRTVAVIAGVIILAAGLLYALFRRF